jgi:acyl-CoA reductase-like NAD-dependent aldehyde dehydrogenase
MTPPTDTTHPTRSTLASVNPYDGSVVGEVPVTAADNIPGVVSKARQAQPVWAAMSLGERRDVLKPLGKLIEGRADEFAKLITLEMGKPINESRGEVAATVGRLGHELDAIVEALTCEQLDDGTTRSTIYHDPFGVCACITPWNFPLMMPHWLVLPALMAGNAVVLKPSEETPVVAQLYVDVLNQLLPPGVLQVVHGQDDQGKALVAAEVDLICFTGSRETGKHIMAAACSGLKRVILELGSKDPLVVLEDADVKAAARFAAANSFRNAGQVCVSTERIYVPKSITESFIDELVKATGEIVIGDGLDESTVLGPMVNPRQRDHVLKQIDEAIADGAHVAFGHTGHHDNFVLPTVLTAVTHGMDIARTETFGPVACVIAVDDEDEAIRLANDSDFGLGAVVFGEPDHASKVARRLNAGMIGVNKSVGGACGAPWVGARQSGYGYHASRDGHRQFCQPRVVSLAK